MEEIDTLLMVGTNFPYTKHLPAPGKVRVAQIEADPARAGGRVADRGAGRRRRPAGACAALLPLLKRRTDTSLPGRSTRSRWTRWRQKMAALEDAEPGPDRAAVPGERAGRAGRRRRHPDLRQRHHRHLGRAALDDPRRPAVLPVRQPGHDGARAALRDRHPARLPGPAGDRLRRRRRLRHADGRVPHRDPAQAAGQGRHQQQQLARPDPLGADGPRLPRARRALPAARTPTSPPSPRPTAAYGVEGQASPNDAARGDPAGAGASTGPRWSTSTSTRTSRRCPARSSTSRRRSSPRRSCKGQPHRSTIATTLFRDKIQQLRS